MLSNFVHHWVLASHDNPFGYAHYYGIPNRQINQYTFIYHGGQRDTEIYVSSQEASRIIKISCGQLLQPQVVCEKNLEGVSLW